MKQIVNKWLGRYFGNEEAVLLAVMLVVFMFLLATVGTFLGPFFAALIIAFLLQGLVNGLNQLGISPKLSVVITFVLFLLGLIAILVGLVPIVGRQMSLLLGEIPNMIGRSQLFLAELPERYSDYVTEAQFQLIGTRLSGEIANVAEQVITFFLSSFPSLFAVAIYLLLVPVLVFFMLSDRVKLIGFVGGLLPANRPVMSTIMSEMNIQFA
ncbi:MAG: AI-2E family transporter, partial [Porticoccaceae bacterium]|nr:AI-2E family transporter [Porticoccaceae bacterium]